MRVHHEDIAEDGAEGLSSGEDGARSGAEFGAADGDADGWVDRQHRQLLHRSPAQRARRKPGGASLRALFGLRDEVVAIPEDEANTVEDINEHRTQMTGISTQPGRVCGPNSYTPTRVCLMAQPHKGDRDQVAARLAHPVYVAVKSAAASRGMPISQYVADVLASHVGRPDLVRQLDQEVLPQSA